MGSTRRRYLETTALVLSGGLAGCAGSGGTGGGSTPTETPTETSTTTPTPTPTETDSSTETDSPTETTTDGSSTATVGIRSHPDLGEILVDSAGTTLYMFERDTQGGDESTCAGDCAEAWPPLTVESADAVSAAEGVEAELGTIERSDGTLQVTAAGWPLYYFASDQEPGDAAGQGVNAVWWVLRPDGTVVEPDLQVREHPEYGPILTDADGMTLYMFDADSKGEAASACYDDCASAWPPFTVDDDPTTADAVSAAVQSFERDTGETQVMAGGWPLYYFASDGGPGDATGQGVNDVWWVLRPNGTVLRPDDSSDDDSSGDDSSDDDSSGDDSDGGGGGGGSSGSDY